MSCLEIRGNRSECSGVIITETDASIALGMLQRGDRKQDVASYFGWNSARLYEIADGRRFSNLKPAPVKDLPPPGPYLSGRSAAYARIALIDARNALRNQIEAINVVLKELE